jgi:predicted TIM-barrel fold metal-dependent hydrolase
MIVDCHVHICEPPHNNSPLSRTNIDGSKVTWSGTRSDASYEKLNQVMDENRIDHAIIMGLEGIVSNEHLGNLVSSNTRLSGFAWVHDPKKPEAIQEIETAITDYGLSGLKLHPGLHSFFPSQPEIVPLIRKAVELEIPVLIHCYPWPPGYHKNNLPYHLDSLKRKVPEASMIVGHMGHINFRDMVILTRHPGLVIESSWGLTLMAELNGPEFVTRFLRRIGIDKIVYGSDWFGPNGEMERQLSLIKQLGLTQSEKEMILGKNICKFMDF